jgi:hypothetical protein
MKKFLNINSWPKSATYLKNLYAECKEPMPITPLYLHNQSISNSASCPQAHLNQTAQADPGRQQVQDQQEGYAPNQYCL